MARQSPLKARPLRNPGQSLDHALDTLLNDDLLVLVLLPAFLWLMAGLEWLQDYLQAPRRPVLFAVAAALATLVCGPRILRLVGRIRALKLGRDGERVVGQFLERLREQGAQVFHDVPGEGFNLDHVVVSKKGVFAIETKTLSKPHRKARVEFDGDRILVAGWPLERDPVVQSRAQVAWLGRLLQEITGKTFPVRGVVVFPSWFVERTGEGRRSPLWVLEPKALPAFMDHEADHLDGTDVALAASRLSRYIRSVPAP
jgi:nuclease-like protein